MTAAADAGLRRQRILGMPVDGVELDQAVQLIVDRAAARPPRGGFVCAANVHMVMEAHDSDAFRTVIEGAQLVLADGAPVAWALRALGVPQHRRVRVTPDLLLELFVACESQGLKLGLYGGDPTTLAAFTDLLSEATPDLDVAYAWSPPFRPLTPAEDTAVREQIAAAGVQVLLVGIGCPKQERWMADHADGLTCVMLGVGAAFDLFGGRTKEAPRWTRNLGLEWTHRLVQEPRRLWRRHAKHDPRFLVLLAMQVARRADHARNGRSDRRARWS